MDLQKVVKLTDKIVAVATKEGLKLEVSRAELYYALACSISIFSYQDGVKEGKKQKGG